MSRHRRSVYDPSLAHAFSRSASLRKLRRRNGTRTLCRRLQHIAVAEFERSIEDLWHASISIINCPRRR